MMLLPTALLCLALNVFHESRGEPIMGQYAVAKVTLNRAQGNEDRVCDEVFKPRQFSWANDVGAVKTKQGWRISASYYPRESEAWDKAVKIATMTLNGRTYSFLNNATHFHTVQVKPAWAKKDTRVARIGRHIFHAIA